MKRVIALGGVVALLLASFPAFAQHNTGGRRFGQGGPMRQLPPQRAPMRDPAADNRGGNRGMQLTPEQRQQLRRDIHDHGRDIYRDRGDARRRR